MPAEPEEEELSRQAQRRQRIEQLKAELVGGDLLSAGEVAEILDIHPRTVNEYVRDGRLKALQVGGGWKISERALRAFVRDLTTDHAQQQYLAGEGPVTAASKSHGPHYKCSFCGKHQSEVRRLIAGPGAVYICDGCVGKCNEIIATEANKEATPTAAPT